MLQTLMEGHVIVLCASVLQWLLSGKGQPLVRLYESSDAVCGWSRTDVGQKVYTAGSMAHPPQCSLQWAVVSVSTDRRGLEEVSISDASRFPACVVLVWRRLADVDEWRVDRL